LASSNTITAYDRVVEWGLEDATGNTGSSASLFWFSAEAGAVADNDKQPPSTAGFWLVKTITFMPTTAATTGGYIQLNEKDSSGPVLWKANLKADVDVYSQTYDPPLRCRPAFYSSLSNQWTTGSKFVFHLA
jgi:hypothetical protein